jgi:hypothetical protein
MQQSEYKEKQIANADNAKNLMRQWTNSISMPIFDKATIHKKRHGRVCAQLYFNVYKAIGMKLYNEHWYEQVSK